MLDKKELVRIGRNEVYSLFGKQYIQNNRHRLFTAPYMATDTMFTFFVGIKGVEPTEERPRSRKGWVVYADILVDATTGEIKKREYALE